MTTVVLAPTGTVSFPDGGGHWWVYLQYALGLRDLGCRVVWLERCTRTDTVEAARQLLARFGITDRDLLLYADPGAAPSSIGDLRWLLGDAATAERELAAAEALVNLDYRAPEAVVAAARRSVLVDIDPGLLQHWWTAGQLAPARHDLWVTTGETVGTARARFGDCGVAWHHIRPPVHLASWPVVDQVPGPFTTVTSWWGDEWLVDDDGRPFENNKRVGFLPFADLPAISGADLELAAYFGRSGHAPLDPAAPVDPESVDGDRDDVAALLAGGWRLRRSASVSGDPFSYRSYIQGSAGEFSCAKPSCARFQNAWISDRTLCYLASGRPAIVEHTGPSAILDVDAGLRRFASLPEAVEALAEVRADYNRHRDAARALVEAHFDSAIVLSDLLGLVAASPVDRRDPSTGRR